MELRYFEPHPALKPLVSSYYYAALPDGAADLQRAESPNLRFFLSGSAAAPGRFDNDTFEAPCAIVCGTTMKASEVVFGPGTRVFGISLTPLGWQSCMHLPADELTERVEHLDVVKGLSAAIALEQMLEADNDAMMIAAADAFLAGLAVAQPRINQPFIDAASAWLGDPTLGGVDSLIASLDVSPRQAERLCRQYFGAPPKRLFRKFRALHASNRLAWSDDQAWLSVAHPSFYDQSHFIRDFREFVGCTPRAFAAGPHLMIRQNLMMRLSISHPTSFSLVG